MFVNWYREEIKEIKKINEEVKVTVWRKDFFIAKIWKIKRVEEDKRDEKKHVEKKIGDKRIDTEGKSLTKFLKQWE